MSDYFANGYFAPKYWTVKYFQGGEVNPNAMSASLSGGGSITAVLVGIEVVTATGTSAGSYNMYRVADEPKRKRKLRKIKYIGPSEKIQTFYIEATKSNEWIPSIIRKPSVLETIERNGLKTRQWQGERLRRTIMADDEWLMLN